MYSWILYENCSVLEFCFVFFQNYLFIWHTDESKKLEIFWEENYVICIFLKWLKNNSSNCIKWRKYHLIITVLFHILHKNELQTGKVWMASIKKVTLSLKPLYRTYKSSLLSSSLKISTFQHFSTHPTISKRDKTSYIACIISQNLIKTSIISKKQIFFCFFHTFYMFLCGSWERNGTKKKIHLL